MRRLEANLSKGEVRRATLDGRAFVVVPVIMARGDVVMNATLVPPSEFEAFAWNGVPVTLRHPQSDGGSFCTANTPAMIEQYRIGTVYNAAAAGGVYRGEVWLDVELTNKKAPDLLAQIESGDAEINVSTGFFSDIEQKKGSVNGRDYDGVHHNIRPDHLAVLPDELGACSYADGCGLRSNIRGLSVEAFAKAWAVMSAEMAKWLPAASGTEMAIRAHAAKEGEGGQPEPQDQPKGQMTMKPEDITALVANAAKEAVAAAMVGQAEATAKAIKDAVAAFAAEQTKATEAAERPALVARVVANSSITKEQADAMDFAALKVVANGLRPTATVATFHGRPIPAAFAAADDADLAKAALPSGIVAAFSAKKKEAA